MEAGQPEFSKMDTKRDLLADELRGFALLGIVLVNAPFIGISSGGYTDASISAWPDRIAAVAVLTLAQAKFYLLFSFLFGYSLTYQLKESNATQQTAYQRRLAGLAILGAIHATFLFVGDILMLYALLGSALLVVSKRSDRFVIAIAAFGAALWWMGLAALALDGGLSPAERVAQQVELARLDTALAEGDFLEAAFARAAFFPVAQATIALLNGFAVLSLFCIGLVAGRHKILREPARHRVWWIRGAWLGLLVGLPCALISSLELVGGGAAFNLPDARQAAALALNFASAPALAVGYVSALALIHLKHPRLLSVFRPAGRMSLTGYIGESLVLAVVFCGFGLGAMSQFGAAGVLLAALCAWLTLDMMAHVWQRHAAKGPLETILNWWSRGTPPRR